MSLSMSKFIAKAKSVIKQPKVIVIKALFVLSPVIPDSTYLRMLFPLKTGYSLNLTDPKTYNEKLQWLKINYRNSLLPSLSDKHEVKSYIARKIGSEYVVKTIGVWDCFKDIDFSLLPQQFVLKTTHDQGGVVVVRNKQLLDLKELENKFKRKLAKNIYWRFREWPYKSVKPRILAEELLEDESIGDLFDYKFYCFNGVPKIMFITGERRNGCPTIEFYDMDFNKLQISRPGFVSLEATSLKPELWDLMIENATQLSSGFPHVRVDFYVVKSKLYVGELTFFTGGGMKPFIPHQWDRILGDFLTLPRV